MVTLFNSLKNTRRQQVLRTISNRRSSTDRIQRELRELGFHHSQQTIAQEYLAPLVTVGLAEKNSDQYRATIFGSRIVELAENLPHLVDVLPPHSECHEELVLDIVLHEPRTYEDLQSVVPEKSVARILNRLQQTGLVQTSKEREYVFFFRTKRALDETDLSPTERKVYENVPIEGLSAHKLATKSKISLRRTYKYLRKLKGKKLVFTRKKPRLYALTADGTRTALMLQAIRNLTREVLAATAELVNVENSALVLSVIPVKRPSEKGYLR
jgi:predicted transcriptional regulator